jgi:ribosomal protein S18 acetylase RimI-like enzyme
MPPTLLPKYTKSNSSVGYQPGLVPDKLMLMHLLDNPAWSALTTLQSSLALINGPARRFPPEMAPHGAFTEPTPAALHALAQISPAPVSIFSSQELELPGGWSIVRKVQLFEMVQEQPLQLAANQSVTLAQLTADDVPQMSLLYQATRPGRSMAPRLHELGGVLGVKQDGRVLAMACLRMHFPGYREISTVGTLPGHTGRGYATGLVAELARRIHAAREIPFLTVRVDNTRAIEIYERLGFRERVRMHSTTVQYERG